MDGHHVDAFSFEFEVAGAGNPGARANARGINCYLVANSPMPPLRQAVPGLSWLPHLANCRVPLAEVVAHMGFGMFADEATILDACPLDTELGPVSINKLTNKLLALGFSFEAQGSAPAIQSASFCSRLEAFAVPYSREPDFQVKLQDSLKLGLRQPGVHELPDKLKYWEASQIRDVVGPSRSWAAMAKFTHLTFPRYRVEDRYDKDKQCVAALKEVHRGLLCHDGNIKAAGEESDEDELQEVMVGAAPALFADQSCATSLFSFQWNTITVRDTIRNDEVKLLLAEKFGVLSATQAHRRDRFLQYTAGYPPAVALTKGALSSQQAFNAMDRIRLQAGIQGSLLDTSTATLQATVQEVKRHISMFALEAHKNKLCDERTDAVLAEMQAEGTSSPSRSAASAPEAAGGSPDPLRDSELSTFLLASGVARNIETQLDAMFMESPVKHTDVRPPSPSLNAMHASIRHAC